MVHGNPPDFPLIRKFDSEEDKEMYTAIRTWANNLHRYLVQDETDLGTYKIFAVTTLDDVLGPTKGWVAYSKQKNNVYVYTSVGALNGWKVL